MRKQKDNSQIYKMYVRNFLTGLVFWYGIDKLFFASIGITPTQIGVLVATYVGFSLVFDIPTGIISDKWSRKGMLVVSAAAMVLSSLALGFSHGFWLALVGCLLWGLFDIAASGTFNAIIYDMLHEQNRAQEYSKIQGRAYALLLVGAAFGNVASGFVAHALSYRADFFLTLIPCVMSLAVVLIIKEPTFHKAEAKEQTLRQIGAVAKTLVQVKTLQIFSVIVTAFWAIEIFKTEFGQLYMLRYFSAPQIIGVLWAVYALTWALGTVLAHRFKNRIGLLVIGSTLPLMVMGFLDNRFSLVLFMVQCVFCAAMQNQIETRIQDQTPSAVRSSILSVLSAAGRAVSVPAAIFFGWLVQQYNPFITMRFISALAVLILIYWLYNRRKISQSVIS